MTRNILSEATKFAACIIAALVVKKIIAAKKEKAAKVDVLNTFNSFVEETVKKCENQVSLDEVLAGIDKGVA